MPPEIIVQLEEIARVDRLPLEEVVKDAIITYLERWQSEHDRREERKPMTKAQAAKLAKRLERVSGLRVTGTRSCGNGYCLDAVDTVTGYPFVISDPDYLAARVRQAADHAALQDYYEAEGRRIKAEEAED